MSPTSVQSVQSTADSPLAVPHVLARALGQEFAGTRVLDGIAVSVHPGELFGLVGPSGCGKTTLVRMIVGLLRPTNGQMLVNGVAPEAFSAADRRAIGYLPQSFSLFPTLSLQQNARFVAATYGIGWWARRRRIREVLRVLDLWDVRRRRADQVSGGMQRRLGLACALLHEPRLLVVDEPTAGLDPDLRVRIWDYLREAQQRGTTIFLTTQYIEEAERCDNVAVMREGHVVASGSPSALRERAAIPEGVDIEVDRVDAADIAALWQLPGIHHVRQVDARHVRLVADHAEHAVAEATTVLTERGREVSSAEPHRPSFEDVFRSLVSQAPTPPSEGA